MRGRAGDPMTMTDSAPKSPIQIRIMALTPRTTLTSSRRHSAAEQYSHSSYPGSGQV